MMYSEKVLDHFSNPRNVGEIEDADGVGEIGNAKCGDIMKMYLKIDKGVITDAKFKTFGCGAAVATSSMATELIKGKSIDDALKLTNQAVVEALNKENVATASAEVTMIPQNYVAVTDPENVKYLQRILDLLDEDDDVQAVYHNWEEPEE